jgi:hypothetical protein
VPAPLSGNDNVQFLAAETALATRHRSPARCPLAPQRGGRVVNLEAELSQMAEENLVCDQESRQEDLRD